MLGGVALAALLALGAAQVGKAQSSGAGFDTSRPPQLVASADGVRINPILSAGDTGGILGDYQMTGIPDGLGAYMKTRSNGSEVLQVLMNHELEGTEPPGVGARVSKLTLDPESRGVLRGSYLINGREGFSRFCSSTLSHIAGEPMYFTGEETTDTGSLTSDPTDGIGRGGTSIALNAETGDRRQTRHFGLLPHENVVPVKGLASATFLTTEDGDPEENVSQLYAYMAPTFRSAISGNEGSLYVWKANDDVATDANPSTDDISAGETIRGHFVRISQDRNTSAEALEAAAQSKDAFDFVRLEDAAVSKSESNRLYINDTGSDGAETQRGRLYRFQFNKSDPTKASLTVVLDNDTSTDPVQLTNPDNLDTSRNSIVLQEDRNSEYRTEDYSRVIVYDFSTKELTEVAHVATPDGTSPGSWESSGVINASRFLGRDRWLLDVQAHTATAPQPGRSLEPNSSTGEDGQLLEIKIPGTS